MTKSVFTRKHERLRQLLVDARKSAKLTQADLAKRLSRPQSFVSKIERGERRLDVVEFFEVAQGIGIDAYAFLRTLNEENGSQEGHPRLENRSRGKTRQLRQVRQVKGMAGSSKKTSHRDKESRVAERERQVHDLS